MELKPEQLKYKFECKMKRQLGYTIIADADRRNFQNRRKVQS